MRVRLFWARSLTALAAVASFNLAFPYSLIETNGSDDYTVEYEYNDFGDREYATYTTDYGTTRWHYFDYVTRGFGTSPVRVFQKLNRMSWTGFAWVHSGEEFWYTYGQRGNVAEATFAMTPQSGQSNYDTYIPDSFGHAEYTYDSGGRVTGVYHYWNELVTPPGIAYDTTEIVGAEAEYAHPLGLKTSTTFLEEDSGDWSPVREEFYTYDSATDWLTGVDYNDGLSNEVTTWGYDVAGNRTSDSANSGTWTYDNLNRMSASPFGTYTNDIVGNRTQFTTSGDDPSYTWDELNRMTRFISAQGFPKTKKFDYQYRADGMRVKKVDDWNTPGSVTQYFYDGQMPIADYWTDGTDTLLTKYGIGARGIDVITKVANGGSETFGYPIYDTHGNMVATLARNGSGYTLGNQQSYDVWGSVRSGSSSEDQGYVANLGHRSDPESFLTYMRARYYEPMSGRFISEDPGHDGRNFYVYAQNNPVMGADPDGRSVIAAVIGLIKFLLGHALMDMITDVLERMDKLTRYMNTLDELLEHEIKAGKLYRYSDLGADALEVRREMVRLRNELNRLKKYENLRRWGTSIGNGISKIIGYNIILWALIDDIDLALSGFGSLEAIYG